MNKEYPIDLVYLWVDGSDKNWFEKKQKYLQSENKSYSTEALDECRTRDNDELKYSLRSVEKYLPWINKIYIVTDNQIPAWLDTDNPKIKVVFHQDFMPQEILPSFNASVIELYLHKIPNLSEYFLYANDDTFVNKELSPEFFFDNEGKPVVRLNKSLSQKMASKSDYANMIVSMQTLIKEKYGKFYDFEPHHNLDAYTKSLFKGCANEFPDEFKKASRFRSKNDAQRSLISFYALATNQAKFKFIPRTDFHLPFGTKFYNKSIGKYGIDSAYLGVEKSNLQKRFEYINPKLFCLNDTQRTTAENRLNAKRLLMSLFAEKSSFEKSTNDLVTIIIPVYNTEKYLNRCLDSVINQTYKNLEIICINDGSKDNSLNILNEYVKKDSRIKVITQENQGVSKARNTGIEISKGKYLTFIDSDDWIEPNMIEEILKTAQNDYSDIVICSHYDVFVERKKPYQYKTKETYFEYDSADGYIKEIIYFPVVPWGKLFKKDFIKDMRFDENLTISEDRLFWYNLLYLTPSITLLKKPLYNYLNERPQSSMSDINSTYKNYEKFITKFKQMPMYKDSKVKHLLLDRDLSFFCWMWYKHREQREYLIQKSKPFMDEIKNLKQRKGLKNYKQMKKNLKHYKTRHISAFMQEIFSIRYDKSKEHKYITILGCKLHKKEKK